MDFDFAWLGQLFASGLPQQGSVGVAQAFVMAAAVLVVLVLLAALATLIGRWLSGSVDRVFEWLLLMAIGAALFWLYLGAPRYL